MKKLYIFIQIFILSAAVGVFIFGFSRYDKPGSFSINTNIVTATPLSNLIANKENGSEFYQVNLFDFKGSESNKSNLNNFLNHAVLLKLNNEHLKGILQDKKDDIELAIPLSEQSSINLMLTRVNILDKDFGLISKSDNKIYSGKINGGIHYRGIVKGEQDSWAALSVFDSFVMGLVATKEGNFVLGSIKNDRKQYTDNYIFYNDRDMLKKLNFKCGDGDMEDKFVRNYKSVSSNEYNNSDYVSADTVAIYYETDYQMYEDNNENLNLLSNYVLGIFNQVATIYQNDQLPIKISRIGYWNHEDPYANDSDSYTILQRFGYNQKDNFEGDLAQLLSTGHNQRLGGIAWINVLCTPYNANDYSGRYSFCNIENYYRPYPTYSWTVTVCAHEMGHNFGSEHTHACHWRIPQGGIGALDSCYYAEGNCFTNLQPNFNGNIMSYCHLNGAINLANGFGRPFNSYWSQPGDTMRIWYQRASCLHYVTNSSEMPVAYDLLQNYPNPFNPSTNIKYALPEDGFVTLRIYDITGREVAQLINNKFFSAGVYSYLLNSNAYNMSSGVYLYRLNVIHDSKDVYTEIKKMVLIK